jgi:hypothetical protein
MSAPTVTYAIFNRMTQRVKIGRTTDIRQRVNDLRCASGVEIELLGTLDGDREREYHQRFKDARKLVEWFELTPALADWLRSTFGARVANGRDRPLRPPSGREAAASLRIELEARVGTGLRPFALAQADLSHEERGVSGWQFGPAEPLLGHLLELMLAEWDEEAHEDEPETPGPAITEEERDESLFDELDASGLSHFLYAWETHLIGWMLSEDGRVTIATWLPSPQHATARERMLVDAFIVDDCNGCCLPAPVAFLFVDPDSEAVTTLDDHAETPVPLNDEEMQDLAAKLAQPMPCT